YQYFPYGYKEVTGPRRRESWFQLVLPYVEQTAAFNVYMADPTGYNAGDTVNQYLHQMTGAEVTTIVPVTVCPSDGSAPGKGANGGTTSYQASYAVCAGGVTWANGTATGPVTMVTGDPGGIFYSQSKTRMTDIGDGTSNTLMAGEGIIRGNTTG